MDFSTLLSVAKKNSEQKKEDGKYYSTKFAPPKKVSKEKKLSDNIQKFLQKKEQEEREKQLEEKRKLANLLAMRDEKSKNKIKKMLKVTKSANKSVLDDVGNTSATNGADELDQDDYGYVSREANAFYQKYIEKVKDVKDDKGFAPSRPQSLKDLSGTKERVKAAITKEIEDKTRHPTKQRIAHGTPSTSTSTARAYTSSKPLYDPEAERREEERQKREEQAKKAKPRKPAPPPMDFQALLKLAEKKQYEPVEIVPEVKKKKEPERLLTAKEKKEIEEQRRAKEAREARKDAPRMEPNGRIPKLNQAPTKPQTNGSSSSSASAKGPAPSSLAAKKPNGSLSTKTVPTPSAKPSSSSSSSNGKSSSAAATSSSSSSAKTAPKPAATSALPKNPYANASKNPATTREFPPRDTKSIKPRQFPPADVQKTRQFPPPDVQKTRQFPPPDVQRTRQFPPADVRRSGPSGRDRDRGRPQAGSKRRIEDDDEDEDEYDSELDDFIDDGDCGEDYSSHIKAIFGYDKSRYRDIDEEDDAGMESNFAQVQREEYISKKIGIREDMEDMKLEAMEKKRKMAMKKRRL